MNAYDNIDDEISYLRDEIKRLRQDLNRGAPRLELLLRRRGFRIYKKFTDDVLLPPEKYINDFYQHLHKYSFRLFLRDVIKNQDSFSLDMVTKYATSEVTGEYISYLENVGLIESTLSGYALTKRPITSFGPTLEWYIAEILSREFGSEAIWGVKFKRPDVGGDYDVIARFDSALIYVEVKSSPPKQIYDREIHAFLDRVYDLSPEIAVFYMDTELRMKDKIVPMFEKELANRFPNPPEVIRMERELFQIHNRIFIVNAKESVIRNVEKVLRSYYRTLF